MPNTTTSTDRESSSIPSTGQVPHTPARERGERADAFVSYARSDLVFVEELITKLTARGLRVWVDLEGLYAGEEFLPRILAAIEGADSFVFILTPESIASSYCLRELEHAAQHHKRVLPVVRHDVVAETVPTAAASRQWLFARDTDDLERTLAGLDSAIRVDPAWVREHSRLLVRAREWESRGRSRSLTLRAAELRDAETWLASARGKDPEPSALHAEFIVASRRTSTRFRGIVLVAVSLALVVAIALATAAVIQRNQKETQRQLAVSRQLAAQAVSTFDAAPRLGMLLAAEGLRRGLEADANELAPQAALQQLLTRSGGVPVPLDADPWLQLSAHGSWLLGVDANGKASLWRLVRPWSDSSGPAVEMAWSSSTVRDAALAPDGGTMVVIDDQGNAQTFALSGTERLEHPTSVASVANARRVDFVTSDLVAFTTADGLVLVVPSAPGTAPRFLEVSDPSTRLVVGPNGEIAAGVEFMGPVWIWNLDRDSSQPIRLAGGATEGFDPTVSADGRWLAVEDLENVMLWDLRARGEPQELHVFEDRVGRAAFSPDGRWLAAGIGDFTNMMPGDETLVLWRMTRSGPGERYELAGHTEPVTDFAFTSDGHWLVSSDRGGRLIFWSLTAADPSRGSVSPRAHEGEVRQLIPLEGGGLLSFGVDGLRHWNADGIFTQPRVLASGSERARTPTLAEDGRWLSVIAGDGSDIVRVWELEPDGKTRASYTLAGFTDVVLAAATCPFGGCVATGTRDGMVQLWRLDTGEAVATTLAELPVAIQSLEFNRDGSLLAAGGGALFETEGSGFVRIWAVGETRAVPLLERDGLALPVSALAFDGDNRWLAVTADDGLAGRRGALEVWPVTARPIPFDPEFSNELSTPLLSVVFGPGARLAAGGQDGRVHVYEGDGWQDSREFVMHEEPQADHGVVRTAVTTVDLSTDGKWLAASSFVGPVRLWRMDQSVAEPIALRTGGGNITSARFDPSGRWLATDDGSGRLALWSMAGDSPRLAPLGASSPALSGLVFDLAGERLVGADDSGNVRLLELRPSVLLALACRFAGRDLTGEEWSQFLGAEQYRKTCTAGN